MNFFDWVQKRYILSIIALVVIIIGILLTTTAVLAIIGVPMVITMAIIVGIVYVQDYKKYAKTDITMQNIEKKTVKGTVKELEKKVEKMSGVLKRRKKKKCGKKIKKTQMRIDPKKV